jgi:plasmid stability protein
MARTTLTIDDVLLRELKIRAAREGRSVQEVTNDLLRRGIKAARPDFRLRLQGSSAKLAPGVDLADRDRLFDLMDEDGR